MGFKDILNGLDSDLRAKLSSKLPGWEAAHPEIPTRLCLEQCSSQGAAAFKAALAAANVPPSGRIADLTGGLGSDTFAFSRIVSSVWYNERDQLLLEAVKRNFGKLEIENVVFNNFDICPGEGEWLGKLREFGPDIIYLDPARRNSLGRKVFLLEDCSPDVTALLPLLLDVSDKVMVKLSPMADISLVCNRLESRVSDVYVISFGGECKELLCLAGREMCAKPTIHVCEDGIDRLSFTQDEEASGIAEYPSDAESFNGLLLELLPSALKAGLRKLPCSRFGIVKIGRNTNLYLASPDNPALSSGLFKVFRILESSDATGKDCRAVRKKYPFADVSAHGIPMTSAQLRSRLGVRDGNNGLHIFGAAVDFCGVNNTTKLIFTRRLISGK